METNIRVSRNLQNWKWSLSVVIITKCYGRFWLAKEIKASSMMFTLPISKMGSFLIFWGWTQKELFKIRELRGEAEEKRKWWHMRTVRSSSLVGARQLWKTEEGNKVYDTTALLTRAGEHMNILISVPKSSMRDSEDMVSWPDVLF